MIDALGREVRQVNDDEIGKLRQTHFISVHL